VLAAAAEKPDWAFPVTEKDQPAPRIEGSTVRPAPPGSTLSITRAKADDFYDIPNWYPDMYPAMPKIVQYGNKETQVRGCGDLDTLLALLATPDTMALMVQVERDAPQLAHGGDNLPAEFEPLHALIARMKTDLQAAETDDTWKRDVTRAG